MKDRQTRLECLKIAATIKCQMKDSRVSTVELATQFYAFVNAESASKDEHAADSVSHGTYPQANYR